MSNARRLPLLALALIALLLLAACGDDENKRLVFTDPITPDPTLDNLWPNAEGQAWVYDIQQYERNTSTVPVYETAEEVPDAPSLDEVAPWLDVRPLLLNPQDHTSGVYRLKFDGQVTTESGVTAQYLTETLYLEQTDGIREFDLAPAETAFLALLARVRPDLRARIEAAHPEIALAKQSTLVRPFLLAGYAWEKTAEYIGAYGDVDQELSWLFLEPDLTVGHEFSFQLVPSLADDVFLHARVLRQRDIQTDIGKLEKTVEVLYLIDMGLATETNIGGEPTGYSRALDFGSVVYAPGVGPVMSTERSLLGWTEDGPTDPAIAWDIQVMATSPGIDILEE